MTNKQKDEKILNVPPLRFPEFSEEWERTTLGCLCEGFDYGMNAPAKKYDGENKYIRITDIDETTGKYLNNEIVSPNGNLREEYMVKENDILLARTGASTGKSYLYNFSDGKIYFAGFLIRCNVLYANPYFVYSNLHTKKYWHWVKVMSVRSGQPGINSQEYSSYPLSIPSRNEQNKISQLFSKIDARIHTQNKIVENLQSLIKGLAVLLTTKGKPNTEISNCLKCHSSTLQESEVNQTGLFPVYGANGKVGYTNDSMIADEAILIIKDGSGVGNMTYVNERCSVLGTLNYLISKGEYHLRYIYYALMPFNFEPYKTGMAIPHIYFKDYSRAKIWCPQIKDQIKIAKELSLLEDKIALESKIERQLQLQKKHLLQTMFI